MTSHNDDSASSKESVSEDWKFKLRLFLSADISGSTAYKSRGTETGAEWANTFKDFFREFPNVISQGYEQPFDNEIKKIASPERKMSPWKFSGDEILFYVDLYSYLDVATHLQVFKNAIHSFPEKWGEELSLGLKGTAWLAGFPVNNTTVRLPSVDNQTTAIDFIGPAIDLGFRITKFSTNRYFVLSVELALMLLRAKGQLELEKNNTMQLHFHGWEFLKGVNQGRKYPIIWLDVYDGEETAEFLAQNLYGNGRREINSEDFKKFLTKYIKDEPNLFTDTFIESDSDTRYSAIPEDVKKKRDEMMAAENQSGYLSGNEIDDPSSMKEVSQSKIKTISPALPPEE